ncbi:anti-sigma factor family protein [Aureliella helgolandensis]|uniref:Zinc-finger domain-containing protein n=1 Tax=Aureliella helgolandensis TaxID=2527968 RepID=A0A518G6N2_9BACT|nr:hypothetical protein [Aureliella helgolandensis]QDV24241.1 hypothetical protein Q31a_25560 [Aureliella helgolandensis]
MRIMTMPIEFDDESLVAFLDGELPAPEASVIESALESDASLQNRVRTLRNTWDLLGELPEVQPNPVLAQSTIEMVALAVDKESRSWISWLAVQRWRILGLACLLALLAGASVSRSTANGERTAVLNNLHVLVEYYSLKNIPSPEFLEGLTSIDNLSQLGKPSSVALMVQSELPLQVEEREQWIEELDVKARGQLEARAKEFNALPPGERQRILAIADYILSQPERAAELFECARNYEILLSTAPARFPQELGNQPLDEQMALIRQQANKEAAFNYVLSISDYFAIQQWLDDLSTKILADPNGGAFTLYSEWIEQRIFEELSRADEANSLVTQIDVEDLIQRRLSAPARKLLLEIADPTTRRNALYLWVTSVVQSPGDLSSATLAGQEDLRRPFKALSEEQRELLQLMPAAKVHEDLRSRLRGAQSDY